MACSTSTASTNVELLLVGKTGNGKSSSGNSILNSDTKNGSKYFIAKCSTTSVTKDVKRAVAEGSNVAITDIPGLFDTKHDDKGNVSLAEESIRKAVKGTPDGFHALLFVLRFAAVFTKEEVKTVSIIKSLLGENIFKDYGICIFTCGDFFESLLSEGASELNGAKSFTEWCEKQTGDLFDLLQECCFRYVLFDNKTEDPGKLREQREVLLTMVESLRQGQKTFGHSEPMFVSQKETSKPKVDKHDKDLSRSLELDKHNDRSRSQELDRQKDEAERLFAIAVSKVEYNLELIREKFPKDIVTRDAELRKCLVEFKKQIVKIENLSKRHGGLDYLVTQMYYYESDLRGQLE